MCGVSWILNPCMIGRFKSRLLTEKVFQRCLIIKTCPLSLSPSGFLAYKKRKPVHKLDIMMAHYVTPGIFSKIVEDKPTWENHTHFLNYKVLDLSFEVAVNLFTERNSDAYLKEYFLDRAFHDDVFISWHQEWENKNHKRKSFSFTLTMRVLRAQKVSCD